MKDRINKEFEITQDGGWWIASTPARDRQDDRVFPMGLNIANYRKNPVMIWAHDYHSPFAVIGKAVDVQVTETDFRVKPEWREPASESDPMHIIRALIDAGLVRTLSIGFNPTKWEDNDFGGYDFLESEILEVSIVPVPANQEALRLAVKGLTTEPEQDTPQGDGPADNHAEPVPESTDADVELGPELRNALAEMIAVFKQHYGGNCNE